MNRLGFTVLVCATVLAACERQPETGQAQADAQTRAACESRAEEVYNQQNRAEIFSPPVPVNTPYSANYNPNRSERGLSDLFVHDRMVNNCIRNTGTGTERSLPPQQR